MRIVIIITAIIVILILVISTIRRIEPYDSVKQSYTMTSCANTCKIVEGCKGFAYNNKDGTCYLSKNPLVDIDNIDAKYIDEYNTDHLICNKISPIDNAENAITKALAINNATYNCIEEIGKPASLFLSKKDNFKPIKNEDSLYRYEVPESYTVEKYDWDKEMYFDEAYISKQDMIQKMLDTNTNNILKFKSDLIQKQDKYDDLINNIDKDYKKFDDFNVGDYLHPYHCIKDIDLPACMLKCNENNECIGFEFNPEFITNNKSIDIVDQKFSNATDKQWPNPKSIPNLETSTNLCCMKKNIGPFIKRKNDYDKYKDGVFYIKSKYIPLNNDFVDTETINDSEIINKNDSLEVDEYIDDSDYESSNDSQDSSQDSSQNSSQDSSQDDSQDNS